MCGLGLIFAAPDRHETNGQVEVTCQTLQTITDSIMLHAWVSDEYLNFL